MLIKRIFLSVFALIVFCLIGWMIMEAIKPEVLPVGSIMPKLKFVNTSGPHILQPDSINKTMIIRFNRDCEHCMYELNLINNKLSKFKNINIFILTSENDFFKSDYQKKWPDLTQADNVQWGVVDKNNFKNKFGSSGTPYILIFNQNGVLLNKITGEIKISKILEKFSGSGTLD